MHTEEEKDRKKCRIMSHKVISGDVPARLNLETGQWLDANMLLHCASECTYGRCAEQFNFILHFALWPPLTLFLHADFCSCCELKSETRMNITGHEIEQNIIYTHGILWGCVP